MDHAEAARAASDGYDRMAQVYADHVAGETSMRSLGLSALELFAHHVTQDNPGPVADVGCGPGHITAYLAEQGLDILGVDGSAELLTIARAAHPELRFELGEMAALPIATNSLHGVVAKHSIIHTPAELVPAAVGEFARTLITGGLLYLSFFGAERPDTHGEAFDHAVTTAYQLDVDAIADMLAAASLVEEARIVRQPRDGERQLPHAILLARNSVDHRTT